MRAAHRLLLIRFCIVNAFVITRFRSTGGNSRMAVPSRALGSPAARISTLTRADLRRQVSQHVIPWFPIKGTQLEQLDKLLKSELPLSALCDILSFALALPIEVKQQLLEDLNVRHRVEALLTCLKAKVKFPPDFSTN